jgi:hypothetical protein
MTQPTEGEILKTCETEEGSINLSCARKPIREGTPPDSKLFHTGTFFCDSTTAHDFPLTPTDVMLAAVMALKAYSRSGCKHRSG